MCVCVCACLLVCLCVRVSYGCNSQSAAHISLHFRESTLTLAPFGDTTHPSWADCVGVRERTELWHKGVGYGVGGSGR